MNTVWIVDGDIGGPTSIQIFTSKEAAYKFARSHFAEDHDEEFEVGGVAYFSGGGRSISVRESRVEYA